MSLCNDVNSSGQEIKEMIYFLLVVLCNQIRFSIKPRIHVGVLFLSFSKNNMHYSTQKK